MLIVWEGDTLAIAKGLSVETRRILGTELRALQTGKPADVKFITTVGPGVRELRVWAADGTYRAFFVQIVKETIHVLHIFEKKSQQTPITEIKKGNRRFRALKKRLEAEKGKGRAES